MVFETLNFGRHKNKSTEEVWCGNYQKLNLEIIEEFINETLDYIFGLIDPSLMILSTGYNFSEDEIDLIK